MALCDGESAGELSEAQRSGRAAYATLTWPDTWWSGSAYSAVRLLSQVEAFALYLSGRRKGDVDFSSCAGCESHEPAGDPTPEVQVRSYPSYADDSNSCVFDNNVTPRSLQAGGFEDPAGDRQQITPRQRDLRDKVQLPFLASYPVPPHAKPSDSTEEKKRKLLGTYQEFVLDLHTGMYLTQLTSTRDYSDFHCQLSEDMQTLKLDQSSGCIIEFPLLGVSKVYRIVKKDDKWYSASNVGPSRTDVEHIVVVEFVQRKLAFVFTDLAVAQRFLMCMELLIRSAQQKHSKKTDIRCGESGLEGFEVRHCLEAGNVVCRQ